jgi:hypothetical protein
MSLALSAESEIMESRSISKAAEGGFAIKPRVAREYLAILTRKLSAEKPVLLAVPSKMPGTLGTGWLGRIRAEPGP